MDGRTDKDTELLDFAGRPVPAGQNGIDYTLILAARNTEGYD